MMNNRDKDITLKDIVYLTIKLKKRLRKNLLKILLFTFLVSSLVTSLYFILPEKYEANASLLLKENTLGNNPLLSGIVGDLTGASNMFGGIGEDAFIIISQSKEVVKKTLLRKYDYRGKKDFLNNHLLDYLGWKEEWSKDQRLNNFSFKSLNTNEFTFLEDSIYNCIYTYLIEDKISITSLDGGIVNVSVILKNDSLAKAINLHWVDEMIAFFKHKSSSSIIADLKFQKHSIDSLQNIITDNEVFLTKLRDEHNAIVKAKAYLDEIRIKRQIEINTVLLGEMIKNHEISKYSYMTQKPIVEIIELPRLPLETKKKKIKKVLALSFIISFMISIAFYVFFPYLKEEMLTS